MSFRGICGHFKPEYDYHELCVPGLILETPANFGTLEFWDRVDKRRSYKNMQYSKMAKRLDKTSGFISRSQKNK